jgi:hypothetical protein
MRGLVLLVTLVSVCDAAKPSAKEKREAAYQTWLHSYSDVLKPGMTRKYVEDYLRSKGVTLQQFCCIDERSAFADLLKIGKEKHPWYCGEHNVYIAFQFAAVEPHTLPETHDSDTLRSVTVFHQLEGCL